MAARESNTGCLSTGGRQHYRLANTRRGDREVHPAEAGQAEGKQEGKESEEINMRIVRFIGLAVILCLGLAGQGRGAKTELGRKAAGRHQKIRGHAYGLVWNAKSHRQGSG